MLSLWTLRSRLAFFREDAQARIPQGSGPTAAEAQRKLQSWGSQMDMSAEVETGTALSLPSPDRFSASYKGWEVVAPREVVVSASNLHPWGPQYRSRHSVETGAEAPP